MDNQVTVLPDGSAFATASWPLPKTHWLYAEGHNVPPMPLRMGTDYVSSDGVADLRCRFSADQLEAIATWMRDPEGVANA